MLGSPVGLDPRWEGPPGCAPRAVRRGGRGAALGSPVGLDPRWEEPLGCAPRAVRRGEGGAALGQPGHWGSLMYVTSSMTSSTVWILTPTLGCCRVKLHTSFNAGLCAVNALTEKWGARVMKMMSTGHCAATLPVRASCLNMSTRYMTPSASRTSTMRWATDRKMGSSAMSSTLHRFMSAFPALVTRHCRHCRPIECLEPRATNRERMPDREPEWVPAVVGVAWEDWVERVDVVDRRRGFEAATGTPTGTVASESCTPSFWPCGVSARRTVSRIYWWTSFSITAIPSSALSVRLGLRASVATPACQSPGRPSRPRRPGPCFRWRTYCGAP